MSDEKRIRDNWAARRAAGKILIRKYGALNYEVNGKQKVRDRIVQVYPELAVVVGYDIFRVFVRHESGSAST